MSGLFMIFVAKYLNTEIKIMRMRRGTKTLSLILGSINRVYFILFIIYNHEFRLG